MLRYNRFVFAVSLATVCALAPQASFGQTLKTIALSGDTAAGTIGGQTFEVFMDAVINDRGDAALQARLTGAPTPFNGEGIWTWNAASGMQAEVITGTQAPDSGFRDFQNIYGPTMNNNREIAFRATVGPLGNSTDGFWTTVGGTGLQKVAIIGEEARALGPEWLFSNINPNYYYERPALNDDGRIAFIGEITSTSPGIDPQYSAWNWTSPAGLELVTRTGDSAAGLAGDHVSWPYLAKINRQGMTLIATGVDGPGSDFSNDQAMLAATIGGSPTLLAREGDPAADVPDAHWENLDSVIVSDAGHLYFRAQLTTVPSAAHQGFWTNRSGPWEAIAKWGDPTPELPGQTMRDFGWDLTVNEKDRAAFSVYDGSINMLYSEGRTGALEFIAVTGTQAPGLELGRTYLDFGAVALNDRGQLLYNAYTRGPGAFDPFLFALYVHDTDDQIKLIAAEGDYLDVDDGPGVDLRKIISLSAAIRDMNEAGAINRLGQVVFTAYFDDGTSGVFVSNLVAVPEPSFVTMALAIAFATICAYPRRQ